MVEVLPIRILREEDGPIFGKEGVALGKLDRAGIPVASGLVITAPHLKLRVILEHHDFGSKEVFEQSLTLVKKEIEKIPIPEVLEREVGQHTHFWLADSQIKSVKKLWLSLLFIWIEEIKNRLWQDGFYQGITDGLESQTVIFVKKIEGWIGITNGDFC
ncbi:hypothetical protein HYS94_00675 [Candidatus Daviesbacteria bacterium]|nr:hypothetical protein [Candidatus Daviesbacteria bacterium]